MKSLVRSEGAVTVSAAGACPEINTEVDRKGKKEETKSFKTCFKEKKKGTSHIKECYALMSTVIKNRKGHQQSPTK